MTIEQITAINNSMSMLADLCQTASMMTSLEDYKEYTNQHIKALRDSGVDNNIVEHFKSLCHLCLPIAEDAVRQHEKYIACCEEDREWEEMEIRERLASMSDSEYFHTHEEDLAALQELKAKLSSYSVH